jgi:hypothetical protein
MDRRGPNVSTVIAAWAMAIWQGLARTARAVILIEEVSPCRPEAYYMRGPGPKWREKHARARGSSPR